MASFPVKSNTNDDDDSDDETISSLITKTISNLEKNNLLPMPDVISSKLSREFEFDNHLAGVEITSLDITASGCSVLAGCSNGMVVLFDMTSGSKKGLEVAHIRAKGMHTNLLATVRITEDCRFGFVGVLKGSMEMIAIDMSRLPIWTTKRRQSLRELISIYSHSDSKLRGFGAVCRVKLHQESSQAEYRLLCGRGIKNIHIWSFVPDATGHSPPQWTCLLDMPTNGNTIETMSFRKGGNEVLSKSAGMSIRVWDLTNYTSSVSGIGLGVSIQSSCVNYTGASSETQVLSVTDTPSTASATAATPQSIVVPLATPMGTATGAGPTTPNSTTSAPATGGSSTGSGTGSTFSAGGPRPAYADVPATQDSRLMLGNYAYGGTYYFMVVRLDGPVAANKEAFALPVRGIEDDNGQRRKRMMRQISDVTGTQDGSHVLVVCTDGSVLYYGNPGGEEPSSGASLSSLAASTTSPAANAPSPMVEVTSLQRDPDCETACAWSLRRVGRAGVVVLLRGYLPPNASTPVVRVQLLSELVPELSFNSDQLCKSQRWYEWDCFRSPFRSATAPAGSSDGNVNIEPDTSAMKEESAMVSGSGNTSNRTGKLFNSDRTAIKTERTRREAEGDADAPSGDEADVKLIRKPPITPALIPALTQSGEVRGVSSLGTGTSGASNVNKSGSCKGIAFSQSPDVNTGTGSMQVMSSMDMGSTPVVHTHSMVRKTEALTQAASATIVEEGGGSAGVCTTSKVRLGMDMDEPKEEVVASSGGASAQVCGDAMGVETADYARADRVNTGGETRDEAGDGNEGVDGDPAADVEQKQRKPPGRKRREDKAREREGEEQEEQMEGVQAKVRRRGLGNGPKKKKRRLDPGPPPAWSCFKESAVIISKAPRPQVYAKLVLMKSKWMSAMLPEVASVPIARALNGGQDAYNALLATRPSHTLVSTEPSEVDCVLRATIACQDRLLSQFAVEIVRLAESEVSVYCAEKEMEREKGGDASKTSKESGAAKSASPRLLALAVRTDSRLLQLVQRYRSLVAEVLQRQDRELCAAMRLECVIGRGTDLSGPVRQVFEGMERREASAGLGILCRGQSQAVKETVKMTEAKFVDLADARFHLRHLHPQMFAKADLFAKALNALLASIWR